MINFDVEPEFQEQIDWVEKFAKEEIEPLDNFFRIGRRKPQRYWGASCSRMGPGSGARYGQYG